MKLKTKSTPKARPKALHQKPADAFRDVIKLIQSHQSFLITTHVNPDGDGLGAETALFLALRKLGKKVQVVNHDPLPKRFGYLAIAPQYKTSDRLPEHEVCFVLDAGDFNRIREGVKREEFKTLVNIDHHSSNTLYGNYNMVMPQATATGEVVYDLIRALKVKIDRAIAESVYTSIVTDTGRFRYSNTTPRVFRLAAELEEAGADISKISEHIFGDISRQVMELNRLALATLKTYQDGAIASMILTQEDFLKSGASEDDTENLINMVRNLEKVQIAICLKERSDGKIKLSLRSKNGINVAEIAKGFNGGGHAHAAAAVLQGPLGKALQDVLKACQAALP